METNSLKIAAFNCRSIYSKLSEIKLYLEQEKPHVLCLTETWIGQDKTPKFKNYVACWRNRVDARGGGIGILVRSDVPILNEDADIDRIDSIIEIQKIIIKLKSLRLNLFNIYNPQGTTDFRELEHYFKQLDGNFIIVGDLNAHHSMWSLPGQKSNRSGNAIAKILEIHQNINLATPPKQVTYLHPPTGTMSVLDLCFSSSRLASDLEVAMGPCLGSDHYLILLTLKKIPYHYVMRTRKRYKISNVNWTLWKEGLPDISWEEGMTLQSKHDKLVKCIKSSKYKIEETSGKYDPTLNKSWWNTECADLVRERNKARHLFERHPKKENLDKYKSAQISAKTKIQESKNKSWQEYASSLNSNVPITQVWNEIGKLRNTFKPSITILEHEDVLQVDPPVKSEIIADHFGKFFNE